MLLILHVNNPPIGAVFLNGLINDFVMDSLKKIVFYLVFVCVINAHYYGLCYLLPF